MSARHALGREVRLYDRLFTAANPEQGGGDFLQHINRDSLEVLTAALEPALGDARPGERFQFERLGYFIVDPAPGTSGRAGFLRTVTLSDSWAKIERQALRGIHRAGVMTCVKEIAAFRARGARASGVKADCGVC